MKERLIRAKNHPFFKYTWVGGIFSLLNIILLWVMIDILKIPTLISSTVVVGGLFVAKYFAYKLTGFAG